MNKNPPYIRGRPLLSKSKHKPIQKVNSLNQSKELFEINFGVNNSGPANSRQSFSKEPSQI